VPEVLNARWQWTLSRRELVDEVRARLVSAGLQPSADLAGHVDGLMGVLIVQGQVRYRLDPVLPDRVNTSPLRLDEPLRRMAELTRLPLLDGTRDRDALVEALLDGDSIGLAPEAIAEHVDGLTDRLVGMKLLRVDRG
jgi:hypothetical protein